MNQALPTAEHKALRPLAMFAAVLMAFILFLLIPLTQTSNDSRERIFIVRETVTIQPPQSIVPPTKDQPKEPELQPQPEFKQQVPELSLSQLELSLNPGVDDAVRIGVKGGGFITDFNTVSDIQEMFTFSDLEQAPNIINQPRVQFPSKLSRRGVKEGRVVATIEIDERGRATIIRIVSSTSPELIDPARSVIRQARFTQPTVNGKPSKVRGDWPIVLRAPK
ncbi:MAG: energy transducer TonB [Lentimonas sp.]